MKPEPPPQIGTNRVVVNLKKVQWARFYYTNQWGQTRNSLPTDDQFTVYDQIRAKTELVARETNLTMYQMAKDKKLLDIWTPTLHLCLTANQSLVYTSHKATSMFKAWQAYIFGK